MNNIPTFIMYLFFRRLRLGFELRFGLGLSLVLVLVLGTGFFPIFAFNLIRQHCSLPTTNRNPC